MIKTTKLALAIFIATIFKAQIILCSGGGILPYITRTKKNGKTKIFFLLGREVGGKYKRTWGDFGGKGKQGEKDYEVAAREGSEELMGVLSKKYISGKTKGAIKIGGTYIINIEDLVGKNPHKGKRDDFIKKLNKKRASLIKKQANYALLEKDKFSFWRRKDLIKAIKSSSSNLRPSLINVYGHNIQTLKSVK